MTLADLARTMYDCHHSMRSELGALRLEAAMPAPDLAGHVAAAVAKLNEMVGRADAAVETYVAAVSAAADNVSATLPPPAR